MAKHIQLLKDIIWKISMPKQKMQKLGYHQTKKETSCKSCENINNLPLTVTI